MAEKKSGGALRGLAVLASMGTTLVAATFTGLAIGIYLDRYLGTTSWFTVIFLLLGIAAGFKQIYDIGKKYGD
ncbi:MAG: AtpZ/AtpI family protein [Deltaproteobacteria bacterium]|nr:AtpZ/AtpI family protein [Deltaproteobacteria bacterium]